LKKEAIVLLNMGGPNNLNEVEVFLKNMFNDKNIITVKSSLLRKFIATMITFTRTESSQQIYEQLGGKSPLVDHTKKLVQKLQQRLPQNVIVDFAMRYTPPFASQVVERLNEHKVDKIYLIPLYPQFSTTTTKSSLEDFEEQYHLHGENALLTETKHFFQNTKYNEGILFNIDQAMKDSIYEEYELIFSAHGLPQKIVDAGDVYQKHVIRHVDILKEMLAKKKMNFSSVNIAYQSKVGPMQWLTPSLDEKLEEFKGKKVLIFPIAFTIDNSETDFELEIEYREIAQEIGLSDYKVARCPNDSELFVEALIEIYENMR